MKTPEKFVESKQISLGRQIQRIGYALLAAVGLVCALDLWIWPMSGLLAVPLIGYLAAILTGVALQFVGAALPNMRFTRSTK